MKSSRRREVCWTVNRVEEAGFRAGLFYFYWSAHSSEVWNFNLNPRPPLTPSRLTKAKYTLIALARLLHRYAAALIFEPDLNPYTP